MTIYFEDVEVGESHELGSRTVTREEILEFAEEYDPQPFHVDEGAAEESMYGGLIASGWHTAALSMRLFVDGWMTDRASMGARGVDELRWYRPVRPGDTLSASVEVLGKRPSESAPDRGHVRTKLVGRNGGGERVISWTALGMIERREPAD